MFSATLHLAAAADRILRGVLPFLSLPLFHLGDRGLLNLTAYNS